jgi:flagella basal body P-ring formation protein FlgA
VHKRGLRFLGLFVGLGLILLCQSSSSSTIELVLLKKVEIDSKIIHLGDIAAEIKGVTDVDQLQTLELLKLKRAPLPGRPPITFDAIAIGTYLRSASSVLRRAGLEPGMFKVDSSARVVVTRKVLHISVESLIQFASDFLHEGLNQQFEADYEIQSHASISDFDLPYGTVEFSARPPRSQFLAGRISIYVDIFLDSLDEKIKKTVVFPFDVTMATDLLVSRRGIDRYEQITADDVNIKRRVFNQLRVPPLILEDLQNIRANRKILEGTMLTQNMVQPIPRILRGAIVPILVNLNGVSVKTRGVALSDGYIGKEINVTNRRSRKTLAGIVTPEGAVQVIVQR